MTEFWELRRPKVKAKTIRALTIACGAVAVLSLAAVGFVLTHPDNSGLGGLYNSIDPFADLGYLAGQLVVGPLAAVVLVWLVLYFAVVRRVAPERGPAHFAALAVVAAIIAAGPLAYGYLSRPPEDPAQMAIANREIATAMAAALDPDGAATFDPTIRATGEAGELERLMKDLARDVMTQHQQYLAELKALGFPNILAGRQLAADPTLAKTRARLAQAAKVVDKNRALTLQRVDAFKAAVMRSKLSGRHKAELINSVDLELSQAGPSGGRPWEIDAAGIAEYQATVEDLARARGRWILQGDRIMFRRPEDLAVFNSHVARIQSLSGESRQIKQDLQSKVTQGAP